MKREELWTPSARRFECLLKAAQNGDYNAYMSLMARFFKVMDDKARNNYLRDYEMFTALVERVSEGIFGFSTEDAYASCACALAIALFTALCASA